MKLHPERLLCDLVPVAFWRNKFVTWGQTLWLGGREESRKGRGGSKRGGNRGEERAKLRCAPRSRVRVTIRRQNTNDD